ncbi:MAG: glyoxalase superfamily protein [Vulcanimicrobiaceae bacterium]|jgi:catechol 2,3-dioxygenase-like lactoylglutathione lyase family enzyme
MAITMGRVVPVLRMFDIAKAREFYLGFLDFEVVFEHRYDDDAPLYMGIMRGDVALHLSEHHGDGCPGARVRVETSGVEELQRELIAKKYGYGRPGVVEAEWGEKSVTVLDPFGNQLTFYERTR